MKQSSKQTSTYIARAASHNGNCAAVELSAVHCPDMGTYYELSLYDEYSVPNPRITHVSYNFNALFAMFSQYSKSIK